MVQGRVDVLHVLLDVDEQGVQWVEIGSVLFLRRLHIHLLVVRNVEVLGSTIEEEVLRLYVLVVALSLLGLETLHNLTKILVHVL